MGERALRALFLAHDGTSVGHLTRALAVARALVREGRSARVEVRTLVATTSEAEALLAWAGVPSLRLPAPARTRAAGWPEAERRRLLASALEAAADAFAPDLLVADTFPSGPHGEAAGLLARIPHRVLVRRSVRAGRDDDEAVRAGREAYALEVVPGEAGMAGPPPITLLDARDGLDAASARAELGVGDGPLALITAGGGGDPDARANAEAIAKAVADDGRYRPVLAAGPLGHDPGRPRALLCRPIPLQRTLRAFDVAIAAAGYNTAHELALAGVPTALFACPRAFDDQAARADRFAAAGHAVRLASADAAAVREALDRLRGFVPRPLAGGGATVAARAILDLVRRPAHAHDRGNPA